MSDSLFEHLFDISPFPAVVSRLGDKAVLAINRRTSEMFGIPHADARGLLTTDYYANPEDRRLLAEPLEREGKADNVLLELRHPKGGTFWARASARLVSWKDEPAVLTVFDDISEELSAERALRESEQRLAAQSRALTDLTARHADPHDKFEDRLCGILEVAAATLHAERVSMWRFDAERTAIVCVGLFRHSCARQESGAQLRREQSPTYFAAVESERVIAAHDARTDVRTRDFVDVYLDPENIGAMLDVPLRQGGAVIGVLCVEHIGGPRAWTVDEQNFAISVANLIVVAIADERRREALARVAESDARAQLIVDTAHDAFVGMDSAGAIVGVERAGRAARSAGRATRRSAATSPRRSFRRRSARRTISGMRRFLETGEAPVVNKRLELRGLHRNGHEFPIEITITSPMRLDHGYFFGAFLRDISDRRERDDAAAAGEGGGRSGNARQERVPRQHEPRAAHAAQRRDRLRAAAAARPRADRARSAKRSTRSRSAARTCSI